MKGDLGVVVIGAGKIGIEHILTLDDIARAGGVNDLVPRIRWVLKQTHDLTQLREKVSEDILPDNKIYWRDSPSEQRLSEKRISQFIGMSDVNAVLIATQPDSHFYYAQLALDLCNHTFVEKPKVLCRPDGDALVELARKNMVIVDTGSQPRVYQKEIGDYVKERRDQIESIQVIYGLKFNNKLNAFDNIMPHLIAFLPWIEVDEVFVKGTDYVIHFNMNVPEDNDLEGKTIPVYATIGYGKPCREMRFNIRGCLEIKKQESFVRDGVYYEKWLDRSHKNPREQLWRDWIKAIATNDVEFREKAYERVQHEHDLFMDARDMYLEAVNL